jgi:phenylalanyl-tRNA synthetase alpha chain
MEGASVLPRDQIERFALKTTELAYQLSHQNISIEDHTTVDQHNPYQPGHQPEHAQLVTENLKATINSLIYALFRNLQDQSPLKVRWIPAYFPFTSPSYEVEVLFQDKWLEILGCGVVQQRTLDEASWSLSSFFIVLGFLG